MFDRINAYNCHKLLVWSVSELKLVEVFKNAKQINLRTDIKLISNRYHLYFNHFIYYSFVELH